MVSTAMTWARIDVEISITTARNKGFMILNKVVSIRICSISRRFQAPPAAFKFTLELLQNQTANRSERQLQRYAGPGPRLWLQRTLRSPVIRSWTCALVTEVQDRSLSSVR